jgi:hypothetical protein
MLYAEMDGEGSGLVWLLILLQMVPFSVRLAGLRCLVSSLSWLLYRLILGVSSCARFRSCDSPKLLDNRASVVFRCAAREKTTLY